MQKNKKIEIVYPAKLSLKSFDAKKGGLNFAL